MSEYLNKMYVAMQVDIMFNDFVDPKRYWIRFLILAHKAGY